MDGEDLNKASMAKWRRNHPCRTVTSSTEFYIGGLRFSAGTYVIEKIEDDATPIEF